jgi:hypothetical protein
MIDKIGLFVFLRCVITTVECATILRNLSKYPAGNILFGPKDRQGNLREDSEGIIRQDKYLSF